MIHILVIEPFSEHLFLLPAWVCISQLYIRLYMSHLIREPKRISFVSNTFERLLLSVVSGCCVSLVISSPAFYIVSA